jgi:tetratricopeptide (TPR) repeat protein
MPEVPMQRPVIRPALAATALVLAAGCANVVYRGPVVRVGEERRGETVLEEKVAIRMELDRGGLSPAVEVRAVRARRVRAERRPLLREYGGYLPFDPLVKTAELLSTPFLFLLAFVLVYQYWTVDAMDGGVGEGDAAGGPGGILDPADAREASREAALDLVVRDPSLASVFGRRNFPFFDWWLLFTESADPTRTSRTLFPGRRRFGPVGGAAEGAWKEEVKEEEAPIEGAAAEVRLGGAPVPGEPAGPGAVRIPLAGRGPGPLVLTAELSAGGQKAEARIEVEAAYLEALERAEALNVLLEADPGDTAARLALADLHAAWGGAEPAVRAIEAALASGANPAECADRLDALYLGLARAAFRAGEPSRACFLDALAEFHRDLVAGPREEWEERGKTPERLLVEGLASGSPLSRARSAALAAGLKSVPAEGRTAALLAALREERSPLAAWGFLWALEKCGTEEAAEVLDAAGAAADDPVLAARARAAVEAIRRREDAK